MKKIKAPVWIFGVMDIICANALGVKPKVFAEKIERLSEKRMDVVINALLEEDEAKHEKARRIFKLIK